MAEGVSGAGRRFLVVHAHPLAESLAASLRDAACEGIAASGNTADLVDLHADGFDPRLSAEEREAFVRPGYRPPEDVAGYCERLAAAAGLVLVFPQWWFGMPAILKGFIDRVFVPGVAFAPNPDTGRLDPCLHGLRSCHVVTTTNSSRWVTELYMGNPVRRQIARGVVGVCAAGAACRTLSMYGVNRATRERCARFVDRVRAELSRA